APRAAARSEARVLRRERSGTRTHGRPEENSPGRPTDPLAERFRLDLALPRGNRGEGGVAVGFGALEHALEVAGASLESHAGAFGDEARLVGEQLRDGNVLVMDEHDGAGPLGLGQRDEVDDALEADREADRRNVLAEEAPDHAVVAAAAAQRVRHIGMRDL